MKRVIVAGLSGGPDSSYLLHKCLLGRKGARVVVGHMNYGLRGTDSEKDQKLVEEMAEIHGFEKNVLRVRPEPGTAGGGKARKRLPAGFEKNARDARYRFLADLSKEVRADAIVLGHTADDQVETILMRVFEGAGIGGLKGIPRETEDGIVRPILDVWKEDILSYLKKRKIPFRIDRSNVDSRLERNWVRNVLLPLLVRRYGKGVKKRIFTLGERFREIDDYLDAEAGRWIRRNVNVSPGRARRAGGEWNRIVFRRKTFSMLPSALRVRILQRICFDRLGVAPNERLLKAMDRNVSGGGPSARVNAGKGWKLANRYEESLFVGGEMSDARPAPPTILIATPGEYVFPPGGKGRTVTFSLEARGKCSAAQAKRLAAKGDAEVFDAADLKLPLSVRPLRAGDRIRPFGNGAGGNARDGGKKVKEILIDRKVPRDDRWGRPALCDAEGAILWIPGVLRSCHAPVTAETREIALLRFCATE